MTGSPPPQPRRAHDLIVRLDDGQFALIGGYSSDAEDPMALLERAIAGQRIASNELVIIVLSPHQNNLQMPFRVEVWDHRPPDDQASWEEVFESGLIVTAGELRYESRDMTRSSRGAPRRPTPRRSSHHPIRRMLATAQVRTMRYERSRSRPECGHSWVNPFVPSASGTAGRHLPEYRMANPQVGIRRSVPTRDGAGAPFAGGSGVSTAEKWRRVAGWVVMRYPGTASGRRATRISASAAYSRWLRV
jgi:hypothetical protein